MTQGDDLRLPGDGIGPEVTAEAVACLEVVAPRHGLALDFEEGRIGGARDRRARRRRFRPPTLERARAADAVLLGAVGGPKWDDPKATVRPEQALLALRKGLGLFANLRPVLDRPGARSTRRRSGPRSSTASTSSSSASSPAASTSASRASGADARARPRGGRHAASTPRSEIARLVRAAFALARQRRKQRHVRRQGERARDVAALARGRERGREASTPTSRSRTCSSTRWRCTSSAGRATST